MSNQSPQPSQDAADPHGSSTAANGPAVHAAQGAGEAGAEDNVVALVRGEPVLELPQDLYIPPDALEVILDTFEGPLDLLLYLIKRQNLDILNIPIAHITEQYMEYIRLMETLRLELCWLKSNRACCYPESRPMPRMKTTHALN